MQQALIFRLFVDESAIDFRDRFATTPPVRQPNATTLREGVTAYS